MNRRKEIVSSRTAKKTSKEVKKGMQQALAEKHTVTPKKTSSSAKKPSSRRSSTSLTPTHAKSEGSRWAEVLKKQTAENERRMRLHNIDH